MNRSFLFRNSLLLAFCLECLVLLWAWIESQGSLTSFFQAAARLSGRVSLLYFTSAFIYATQYTAVERSTETFDNKYRLFRDFAIVHVIHWCFLAISVRLNHFDLVPFRVAGGALAYLLVVLMPWLMQRHNFSEKNLSRLQGFYLFWVWFIFMMTYLTRLRGQTADASGSPTAWWPLAIFTGGLMIWRVYMLWKPKSNFGF